MRFTFEVLVTLKAGLADPAGQGGGSVAARASGWTNVVGRARRAAHPARRRGRRTRTRPRRRSRRSRSRLLSNPVIEDFRDPGDPTGARVSEHDGRGPPRRRHHVPRVARRSRRAARGRDDGRRGRARCGTPTTTCTSVDAVVLPGGFSYGDYLRCGAIAGHAPILDEVRAFADRGGPVLGICNGFQILCEAGLLPGALIRNASLRFVCRDVFLRVETSRHAGHGRARRRARCSRSRSSTAKGSSSRAPSELRRIEDDGLGGVPVLRRRRGRSTTSTTPTDRPITSRACATRPATSSG